MNNSIYSLVKGEVSRLNSYGIIKKYCIIGVLLGGLVYSGNELSSQLIQSFSMLFVVYLGSLFMVVSSLYYEKQNKILRGILILPVSVYEMFISKVISTFIVIFIPYIILMVLVFLRNDVSFDLFHIITIPLYPLFVSLINVALGYTFFIISKDYESLMRNSILFTIICTVISIYFNYIQNPDTLFEYLVRLLPSKATESLLINSVGELENYILFSMSVLIITMFLLTVLIIKKKLRKTIVRG